MNGSLKITLVTKAQRTPPFVFFLFEKDGLRDQSLFAFLTVESDHLAKGAAGAPVRLLVRWLEG